MIFLLFLVLITMPFESLRADVGDCPKDNTEMTLDGFFNGLQKFNEACDRFPSSREGLGALVTRPPKLKCNKKYDFDLQANNAFIKMRVDGWNKRLAYSSDGKTYRLSASHGYYVTEKSPLRANRHWENPHPLPECKYKRKDIDPEGRCRSKPKPTLDEGCWSACDDNGEWQNYCE